MGRMGFRALVTTVNEHEGMAFMNWIPLDSGTTSALEELRRTLKEPRS
jgi:hypothetical protein